MDGVARPSSSHSASSSPLPWLPTTTAAPARASGLGSGSTSLRQSSRPSSSESARTVFSTVSATTEQPPAGVHHQARGVGGRGEGAEHGAGRAVEDHSSGAQACATARRGDPSGSVQAASAEGPSPAGKRETSPFTGSTRTRVSVVGELAHSTSPARTSSV